MDRRAAILEVNVPDPVTELSQAGKCIGPAAEFVMAGIKTKPNELGVGQFYQPLNLPRRLDEPGAMMVEHRSQSGVLANGFGNPVHTLAEHFPIFGREAVLRLNADRKS